MVKRIMMLGANLIQTTAVKAAKKEGYYVITVDNIPNNPGHRYADEYHCVSTVNQREVLELARNLAIDGIVSYGSDVSAPTAAYVAENLGLPTNPYRSVMLLSRKDKFRQFLAVNDYAVPKWGMFHDFQSAEKFTHDLQFPAFVKPVDSSGSKGVSRIFNQDMLREAWEIAMLKSRSGGVIIEESIENVGYQIDGDIFVNGGNIVFNGLCDQHHDKCAPFVPSGLSYPSTQDSDLQERALMILRDIFRKLKIHMGAFNVEYMVDSQDEIHFIEIGPRNGGNWISDIIEESTGVSLARYTVRQAVGDDCSDIAQIPAKMGACSYVIHANNEGKYAGITIAPKISGHVVRCLMSVEPGEPVSRFQDSAQGLGMMLLRFDSVNDMKSTMDDMERYVIMSTCGGVFCLNSTFLSNDVKSSPRCAA